MIYDFRRGGNKGDGERGAREAASARGQQGLEHGVERVAGGAQASGAWPVAVTRTWAGNQCGWFGGACG
jgi:hypothetical protein